MKPRISAVRIFYRNATGALIGRTFYKGLTWATIASLSIAIILFEVLSFLGMAMPRLSFFLVSILPWVVWLIRAVWSGKKPWKKANAKNVALALCAYVPLFLFLCWSLQTAPFDCSDTVWGCRCDRILGKGHYRNQQVVVLGACSMDSPTAADDFIAIYSYDFDWVGKISKSHRSRIKYLSPLLFGNGISTGEDTGEGITFKSLPVHVTFEPDGSAIFTFDNGQNVRLLATDMEHNSLPNE